MPAIVRNIFEEYVKDTFNLQDCIAVNNGTSALIATLWSMNLKPDDEVITTPFTYIATSNSIIIAVHLYGKICDIYAVNEVARRYNIVVIEDTAQAFGAVREDGRHAGMMADAGTFSFYKTKNISTFEGGMICVPKESHLDHAAIRSICDQGQVGKYNHEYIGFNFRLAEPLCLMAFEQMKIHMTGIKAELGLRGPKQGHYPKVVYDQPAYKKLNIRGDCPIAESIADQFGKGEYQE